MSEIGTETPTLPAEQEAILRAFEAGEGRPVGQAPPSARGGGTPASGALLGQQAASAEQAEMARQRAARPPEIALPDGRTVIPADLPVRFGEEGSELGPFDPAPFELLRMEIRVWDPIRGKYRRVYLNSPLTYLALLNTEDDSLVLTTSSTGQEGIMRLPKDVTIWKPTISTAKLAVNDIAAKRQWNVTGVDFEARFLYCVSDYFRRLYGKYGVPVGASWSELATAQARAKGK